MKIFFLLLLFASQSAQAEALVYGVKGPDFHDQVVINLPKRTLSCNSGFILNHSKKPLKLGKKKLKASSELIRFNKFLSIAFGDAKKFNGIIPPHHPYMIYKNRILIAKNPMFHILKKSIDRLNRENDQWIEGIAVSKKGKTFEIVDLANVKRSVASKIAQKISCRTSPSSEKKSCYFRNYTWPAF